MPPHQNIVIIGASSAGTNLVTYLSERLPATHRIILVEALEFGFWPLGALRAAVVDGWEKHITAPLTQHTVFPDGSPHRVVAPNKVVELKENSVILEKPFEGSNEISFHKCVLAVGSSQPSPMRPPPGSTLQEFREHLKGLQKDIARANRIVIVGGGPVGLEMAGEIRAAHPATSITIVHNRSHVLNSDSAKSSRHKGEVQSYTAPATSTKLSRQVEKLLKELHIDTIFNEQVVIPTRGEMIGGEHWSGSFGLQDGVKRIVLESGREVLADFVFISTGNKANSWLVQNADEGAIDHASGMIAVDPYLRVVSTNRGSPLKNNYYAIGDCCSAPGLKNGQSADTDAKHTAVNIINEIQGKPLKKNARPGMEALLITLGPNRGTGTLTFPVIGTVMAAEGIVRSVKGGTLLTEGEFHPRFRGPDRPAWEL